MRHLVITHCHPKEHLTAPKASSTAGIVSVLTPATTATGFPMTVRAMRTLLAAVSDLHIIAFCRLFSYKKGTGSTLAREEVGSEQFFVMTPICQISDE